MTDVKSTETAEVPLSRLALNLARYYLGNRRVLLILGSIALVAGIAFNWSWLVATGIAPLLLTVLPCLIMCGAGLCMNKLIGGSCERESTPSRDAADATTSDATTSPAALGAAKMDAPSAADSSCCHEQADEPASQQVKQLQTTDERRDSHA
jgi:hypothetical protein